MSDVIKIDGGQQSDPSKDYNRVRSLLGTASEAIGSVQCGDLRGLGRSVTEEQAELIVEDCDELIDRLCEIRADVENAIREKM